MDGLAAAVGVAAGLLVLAGLAKLLRPAPATEALAAIGWRFPDPLLQAFGLFEVALGTITLLTGNRVAEVVVALVYVKLTGFVVVAMRHDVASCGCFGTRTARPGPAHVVVNLLLAAGAAAAALTGAASVLDAIRDQAGTGAALVAGIAVAAWLLARPQGATPAAPTASGRAGALAEVDVSQGRTALVFLSTTCLSCLDIWRAFAEQPFPEGVAVVLVTKADEPADAVARLAPPGIPTRRDTELWSRYGVTVAPAVVMVHRGVVVATAITPTYDDVVAVAATPAA